MLMLVTGALLYSRIQAASMVHSFHVYQMSKWQVLMKSAIVKIHPAVCDGKTIGHPCCAVHDCKEPLINNRHRFCATHNIHNLKCAVTACNSQHEASHRTCSDPDHRALENAYFKHGKGIYKLRERLKAAGGGSALASSESSSIPEDHEEDDKEVLFRLVNLELRELWMSLFTTFPRPPSNVAARQKQEIGAYKLFLVVAALIMNKS